MVISCDLRYPILNVTALFRIFLAVCLFRSGPQDLPVSRFLLGLVLVAHWLLGTVHGMLSLDAGRAALFALLGTGSVVAIIHTLLVLKRRAPRSVQTLTAVAGAEVLLGLFVLPVSLLFHGGTELALAALVIVGFIGWNMAVVAHILRHALEVSSQASLVLAMGYIVFSYSIAELAIGSGG